MTRFVIIGCALVGAVLAAGPARGERAVAMAYLEGLRDTGQPLRGLLKTTAISPYLGERRWESLTTLLESIREDWNRNQIVFEVLDDRTDGDYGAVMVKALSELNPVNVEVLAVGIVRREGEWRVAPMMGTFDAVFFGFDDEAERKVAEMERWMSARRAVLHDELGSEVWEKFRAELEEARPDVLADGEPEDIARAFIEACQSGSSLQVLSFLGSLGSEPSSGWFETMAIVTRGLAGQDARRQWRRMVDPDVIRVVTHGTDSSSKGEFTILFFDPHETRVVENWKVELRREKGAWRVLLPAELRYADRTEEEFLQVTHAGRRWQDRRVREQFWELYAKENKPVEFDSAEEAVAEIKRIMQEGIFPELARALTPDSLLSKVEQRVQFAEAAELWSEIDGGDPKREVAVLDTVFKDHAAVTVLSRVDPAKVGWVELHGVQLLRGELGWFIAPGVRVLGDFEAITEEQREDQEAAWDIYSDRLPDLRERAAEPLRKALVTWGGPAEGDAVGEEAARALVQKYREGLQQENNTGILDLCAVVDPGSGISNGLRTLSYEFRGARAASTPPKVLACRSSGVWSGVSVFVAAESHSEPSFPFYLVVPTKSGPRLLIDVDLRLATNKGRSLLNERTLKRLAARLGEDELELVRKLFEEHVELSQQRYDEWEKTNK